MMTPNGGVFGRNPKFNNVTVSGTLTSAGSVTLGTGANLVLASGQGVSFAATSDPSIPAVAATGFVRNTATNVSNNDTVTLGSVTYTFKTALTPADYEVLIGADAAASLLNLRNAINNSGGTPGTDYQVPAANPSATASAIVGNDLPLVAITAGTAGNSVALSETAAQLSVSGATLLGGRAAQGNTAELLDDYEIGTWSPSYFTIGGSSSIISQSVEVFAAHYIKIGKMVYVFGWVQTTSLSMVTTGSTRFGIAGLPYATSSASNNAPLLIVGDAATWGTAPFCAQIRPGTTQAAFMSRAASNGASTNMVASNATVGVTAANKVSFSGCYEAA